MKYFILLLSFLYTGFTAAAVYKTVDENGNVIFTDRKSSGATEQVLSEPSVIAPPPKVLSPSESVKDAPTEGSTVVKYRQLKITHPVHDQAFRSNNGEVLVEIESAPRFGAAKDHYLVVYLDGLKLDNVWHLSRFSIPNVDRGTHKMKVMIVDSKSSKILISSDEIVFHLQRQSVAP